MFNTGGDDQLVKYKYVQINRFSQFNVTPSLMMPYRIMTETITSDQNKKSIKMVAY